MAWSSLWLPHCHFDHMPRSQFPAQPWAAKHCLGYIIKVPVSRPATWIDLILILWVVVPWMDPLDVLSILPQRLSLSHISVALMASCGCILEQMDWLPCWEPMMDIAISLQLCPLCSGPVGLHPIVTALPALGSPWLPAGATSGSSLLMLPTSSGNWIFRCLSLKQQN